MAGLEVVVRPVVFPNIRPPLPRILAPADNPDQGIATFSGSGGRLIDLQHSINDSISRQRTETQTKAVVDTERVYQVDKDGNINKDNYIDVDRTTKARFEEPDPDAGLSAAEKTSRAIKRVYGNAIGMRPPNVEVLETGKVVDYEPTAE